MVVAIYYIINGTKTREMLSDVQSAANCMSVPDAKQLIGFVQQRRGSAVIDRKMQETARRKNDSISER